jgi:hypothetical protein
MRRVETVLLVRSISAVLVSIALPALVDTAPRVGALEASLGAGPRETPLLVRPIPAVVVPVTLPVLGDAALRLSAFKETLTTPATFGFVRPVAAVSVGVAVEGGWDTAPTAALALEVIGVALVRLTMLLV